MAMLLCRMWGYMFGLGKDRIMKIGIERNKFPPCPLRPTLSSSIHSKLLIQLHHNHGPFVDDTHLGKYAANA
ncbi:hypothetical protein JHK85_002812 [Glycine max]|nr:hypothetical protein JHK85_002812 [Glycine max]